MPAIGQDSGVWRLAYLVSWCWMLSCSQQIASDITVHIVRVTCHIQHNSTTKLIFPLPFQLFNEPYNSAITVVLSSETLLLIFAIYGSKLCTWMILWNGFGLSDITLWVWSFGKTQHALTFESNVLLTSSASHRKCFQQNETSFCLEGKNIKKGTLLYI